MKRTVFFLASALVFASCGQTPSEPDLAVGYSCDELYAPWDSISNNTSFKCSCDKEFFNFEFVAQDSTLAMVDEYKSEHDVKVEDRVEIFFSPDSLMNCYHCMEIDPLGRVLDYECSFYRQFLYDWNFSTLETEGEIVEGGYKVVGRLSLEELRNVGIPTDGSIFWIGVFQGDFHSDGSVNWFSRVETADKTADFHKPDVLFKATISK